MNGEFRVRLDLFYNQQHQRAHIISRCEKKSSLTLILTLILCMTLILCTVQAVKLS